MKRFYSLRSCLFDAFGRSHWYISQEDRYMWAIQEGLRRLHTWAGVLCIVRARKDHKCVRNCAIKAGDTYFRDDTMIEVSPGFAPKICACCIAMILYFKEVYNLPPTFHTHWDSEKKAPVKFEGEGTENR
jgi:hypothetical protein